MSERSNVGNLTGSLLVAHPLLRDPNFRRTILFLSHHSEEDGAVGLVLNRPLGKTVADTIPGEGHAPVGSVGIFYGGPVAADQLTIASLQWRNNPTAVAFHSYSGPIDGVAIEPEWQNGLRAFLGYAGWSQGQLESEIDQKAWIVLAPTRDLIEMLAPDTAWHDIMRNSGPLLRLLAEAPDDPELN